MNAHSSTIQSLIQTLGDTAELDGNLPDLEHLVDRCQSELSAANALMNEVDSIAMNLTQARPIRRGASLQRCERMEKFCSPGHHGPLGLTATSYRIRDE